MDKVACRTPAEGRDGVTNIPKWKYDLIAEAIRAELADGPVRMSEMKARLEARIPATERAALGSLGWHLTTVKLEMEVRGELIRVAGKGPQVISLSEDVR